MPDWKPEIKQRLAKLQLAPTREAAIVEELAQHLDDCYAELLSGGATEEEAYRAALAELSESEMLQRELRRVGRQYNLESNEIGVLGTSRRTKMIADDDCAAPCIEVFKAPAGVPADVRALDKARGAS